jgi:signal transduction histidine kinase
MQRGHMKDKFFDKFKQIVTVENIRQRVHWLIWLRWLAGISVIMLVLAGKAFFEIQEVAIPLVLGIFILFYNSIFAIVKRYLVTHEKEFKGGIKARFIFINFQIFLDLTVLAALIYFTGGIANPFLYFFIFHMVIGSILLSRLNAFAWAVFTIIMESTLVYLEHIKVLPHWNFLPAGYPENLVYNDMFAIFHVSALSITLLITVYFATSIMRPIRKRQLDLEELQSYLKSQRDQLEQKNKELQEMDKSKTEFLYRVEHELKAPIGALQSLLSVVIRGYRSVDDDKKRDLLNRAESRVYTMKELVTDLLSLSRINQKSFKLELQTVNMAEILNEVIDELTGFSRRKEIPIVSEIHSPLPTIEGDKNALIEVARNLIHNGVKYSFQGEVNVYAAREDDSLVLRVKDSGIGINEEDLESVFTEFYRTSNAKAFEDGTGLGLALVKRLVEQHNGTISVQSQLNQGTTFTVTFHIK